MSRTEKKLISIFQSIKRTDTRAPFSFSECSCVREGRARRACLAAADNERTETERRGKRFSGEGDGDCYYRPRRRGTAFSPSAIRHGRRRLEPRVFAKDRRQLTRVENSHSEIIFQIFPNMHRGYAWYSAWVSYIISV